MNKYFFLLIVCLTISTGRSQHFESSNSSGLILTKKGVEKIQANLGKAPLFDQTLLEVKEEVDEEIGKDIQVPTPKDLAGGYTHERHKRNYAIAQKAGVLYKILEDEKYAQYIKEMLMEYAKIYPDLSLHPAERSYARGKIFWQALNDSNWLVSMSQAYDSIYDFLTVEEREHLEENLFYPFADFLSKENPKFFNRIHNHSTWGNAAVGMIGLVMDDEELVNRALYGLQDAKIDKDARDDDGGLIQQPGQEAGFLANINEAFSPSGYYTEGPYYQRYAMYPFMLFAKALENKRPKLKIFEFKDGVLLKSVYALLNLTDADGEFFPLNDAQKGMSYMTQSAVMAVDAAYLYGDKDPSLLAVAEDQGRVTLDDAGMAVAMGLANNAKQEFQKKSIELTDGPDGNKGGVAILRSRDNERLYSLVMKYTSQGDSHGHYDKLSFSFYNDGEEVIQDYGFARFVNIEPKNGGGYLKENTSWAKQTIAHNTLVKDQTSHFEGDFDTGSKYHSEKYFSDFSQPEIQIISAKERNAYPGTEMHRTMALMKNNISRNPVVIDIFRVNGDASAQHDLPFYYFGQLIDSSFDYETSESLEKLGSKNGYQHLWKEAEGISEDENLKFTWSNNNKFYTISQVTSAGDKIFLARIGATDPKFNLRRDPVLITRKSETRNPLFVSVIEPHGSYNPVTELGNNSYSQIKNLEVVLDNEAYTGIKITGFNEEQVFLILSNQNNSPDLMHKVRINDEEFSWNGPYTLIEK